MNKSTLLPFYLDSKANVISKGLNFIGQYFLLYDSLNQHPLSKIEDILTTVSVQFAFALCLPLTFRHWGLIAGEVVAIAFSTTTMVINLRDSDILQFRQRIRRNGFRTGIPALLKRFRRFPLVNAPHAISSAAVGLLTVSYIALHFSTVEAGQYFLMFRVVMLPASLIGSAVAPVYFRSAADSYARDGRFEQLMWRMTAALAAVGLVVFSVLASVGEPLFVIVLGEKWRHAGALAAIFAPYVPIHLIVSSLAPTTMVANALTQALYASLGQSVVFLFGLWLGAQIYGTIGGAVALAVYLSVPYMVALALWYARLARGKRQVPA